LSVVIPCSFFGCLHAHTVVVNPDPMILSFGGPDGTISVVLAGDEPSPACQVSASATERGSGPALVTVTPAGLQLAPEVVLNVHVLRQPQGEFETTEVFGRWTSAGIPSPPCLKGVSGSIRTTVTVTKAAPVVNAVVNGASFAGNGIVPGEVATIFGNNLTGSIGINGASSLPLPPTLMDVSVLMNDQPVPLLAVANVSGQQQINFQVPWELEGRSTATLAVNNGVTGSAISVPVVSAQPGIFSYNIGSDTFGAILHADFQLADTAHPATANEIVLIYCTGLGAVSSPPASGAASNAQPTVFTPTVRIGGASARVIFSGLAPGFAGLNQVNVEVPPGLASGNQPVVITVSGASSNPVLLPVK
jgi:uncharacterized protein (TIGR03437 family)